MNKGNSFLIFLHFFCQKVFPKAKIYAIIEKSKGGGNMLKFFAWVFSATRRHRSGVRLYEKGVGGRIWTMVLMFVMVGACVGVELWFLNYVAEGINTARLPILGLIGLICLLVCVIAAAVDYCATFAYVAFRNAFFGVIMTAARIADERNKKRGAAVVVEESNPFAEGEREVKTHKALDIVIGILGILCTVFAVVSIVVVFIAYAKK